MQADAARLEQLWQIENGLHDVRDVTLGEDACQVRAARAPANRAACRNTALNLLRLAGVSNVAAALRRHAMHPRQPLALMGLYVAGKDPVNSARSYSPVPLCVYEMPTGTHGGMVASGI